MLITRDPRDRRIPAPRARHALWKNPENLPTANSRSSTGSPKPIPAYGRAYFLKEGLRTELVLEGEAGEEAPEAGSPRPATAASPPSSLGGHSSVLPPPMTHGSVRRSIVCQPVKPRRVGTSFPTSGLATAWKRNGSQTRFTSEWHGSERWAGRAPRRVTHSRLGRLSHR
jgi:hypothetical protein